MTFLQLEYFNAVAEMGSISRVAEHYSISPAALSRSISQLERELGVQLFDHEGRSIVLNRKGEIFLQCAGEILESMTTVRRRLADPVDNRLVRLRLDVVLDEPGELSIAFKLARPDLTVETIPPHGTGKRYDARIFSSSSVISDPRCAFICSEKFVAALPADHPLASRDSIRLIELKDEPFVLFKYEHQDRTAFSMCEEAGFIPRIGMAFDMTAHRGIYRAISEGLGCSIVPERVGRSGWNDGKVAFVPFSDIERVRYIYAAAPAGEPLSDDCRSLIDIVRRRLVPER